jgi:competence protein ComEC
MADVSRDSIRTSEVNGFARLLGLREYLGAYLGDMLRRETHQRITWLPCALISGIWGYFLLDRELFRNRWLPLMLAAALIGFAAAKFHTERVTTPVLRAFEQDMRIQGHISEISLKDSGRAELVLDVLSAAELASEETPRRIRLSASKMAQDTQVGDLLTITADLVPLPRPEIPGGFDYARQQFLQSIGATGRVKNAMRNDWATVPLRYRLQRAIHAIRHGIGARIRVAVSSRNAAFAEALVTGERASIPRSVNESLQTSGLFHILSISGLHMTLVAGGVFWVFRAAFAAFPRAALRWPIKKYAAIAALAVGFFYMVLADFGAATERSYIMIAVMFFAVLVDRPAISLRNLAIAAIIILLFQPAEAVAAGFQMSFMAVAGLAAFYEWWSRKTEREYKLHRTWAGRMTMKFVTGAAAAIATTLIAGSFSGVVASHHFGRIAPYSVVANAIALPVISFLVMPMALLGTIISPLGLEYLPYKALDFGLTLVMKISDMVSSWPHAGLSLPTLPALSALLFAAALLAYTLCISRLKWIAAPIAATGLYFMPANTTPEILIDSRARNVALQMPSGELIPALSDGATSAYRKWSRQAGDAAPIKTAALRDGWTCNAQVCKANVLDTEIAYLLAANEATGTCPDADIVVSQYPLRRTCHGRKLTIDRFDVWRDGAHSITIGNAGLHVMTARAEQGHRPWAYESRPRRK